MRVASIGRNLNVTDGGTAYVSFGPLSGARVVAIRLYVQTVAAGLAEVRVWGFRRQPGSDSTGGVELTAGLCAVSSGASSHVIDLPLSGEGFEYAMLELVATGAVRGSAWIVG